MTPLTRTLAASVVLLSLGLTPVAAQDGSPLHGLWQVTAGPAQGVGSCTVERTSWYSQIADWPPGSWLALLHRYGTYSLDGIAVSAALPAQHSPDQWAESSRPSQAVVDQINKLGLEYRFTGALSADGNELTGNDTQLCFYWQGDELTGYQKVQVPIRAVRTPYSYGAIAADGSWRSEVKQGEAFYLVLDTEAALGWQQAWVQVLDTNPAIYMKLLPDEANTRYLAGPLTVAEPPTLNHNLPAAGLEGRLYAKAGDTLRIMVYPNLVVTAVTVQAP
jgi:hypothetical protein